MRHVLGRDRDRVLATFVRNGALVKLPAKRWKRLVVLERIIQDFEPGRRYDEVEVNAVLGRWHPDRASLRRYLVDEDYLDRDTDGGAYWRCGGDVDV